MLLGPVSSSGCLGGQCFLLMTPMSGLDTLKGRQHGMSQTCCITACTTVAGYHPPNPPPSSQNKTESITLNSASHQGSSAGGSATCCPPGLPALPPLLSLSSHDLWTVLGGQRPRLSPHCCLPHRAWHSAWYTSATGMNDSTGPESSPTCSHTAPPTSVFLSIPQPSHQILIQNIKHDLSILWFRNNGLAEWKDGCSPHHFSVTSQNVHFLWK